MTTKSDARYRLSWGVRLRFYLRFVGLTALLAVGGGALLLSVSGGEWWTPDRWLSAWENQQGPIPRIGAILFAVGCVLAAISVLVELLSNLSGSAGRRSATGLNAAFQVVTAVAILGALNYYSFRHYTRFDCTRDRQFTLPDSVVAELRKLQGKTTIVVLQQHKTFGQQSTRPDSYDYAAERKIVEKVKDLVDQFREFGPQFQVYVLDVEDEGFDKKLADITAQRPGLKEAIQIAPENSIFFYADDKVGRFSKAELARFTPGGPQATDPQTQETLIYSTRVQRLGFNEFFQLDKTASREAYDNRGNLILQPQGIETFVHRITAIQEKRPKIALAVIHEWLTTEVSTGSQKEFTAAGLRKTLENYGFDVVDLVVKKLPRDPAAYNREENEFNRLQAELTSAQGRMRQLEAERQRSEKILGILKNSSLQDLAAIFRRELGRDVTEEDRRDQVSLRQESLRRTEKKYEEQDKKRQEIESKLVVLRGKERSFEDRRITDVKDKFARLLADCDLLMIPRVTLMNATSEEEGNVPPSLHSLSADQVEVIRDFMKSGKPVFACLGPINEPSDPPKGFLDDFERLLAERGILLGKDTVLFEGESDAYAQRRAGDILSGGRANIPPIEFLKPEGAKQISASHTLNPIGSALSTTNRNVGQALDIRLRYLRPIYLAPGWADKLPYAAEFVFSSKDSWNESMPFPRLQRIEGTNFAQLIPPELEPTADDDPKKGTVEEEREGPFPVGIALESRCPIEWYDPRYTTYKEIPTLIGLLGAQGLIRSAVADEPTSTENRPAASLPSGRDAAAAASGAGILSACLTAGSLLEKDPEKGTLVLRKDRKTSRLAVLGQGAAFNGVELAPPTEKLLLHTCNWLLSRDERLPHSSEHPWAYPRLTIDDRTKTLWRWGAFLGIPMVFGYLGLVVLMIRRMR